jgi:hypothetical protein
MYLLMRTEQVWDLIVWNLVVLLSSEIYLFEWCTQGKRVGLARTIYIRCKYCIFGREITKNTVIYGVYIQFWPTLYKRQQIDLSLYACVLFQVLHLCHHTAKKILCSWQMRIKRQKRTVSSLLRWADRLHVYFMLVYVCVCLSVCQCFTACVW